MILSLAPRITVSAIVLLVVVAVADRLDAGDFHHGATLVCSDCHVIHYSESHLATGAPGPDTNLAPGGPFTHLLKAPQSQLCLTCHDGQTNAPDVMGPHSNNYVRAAGQLNSIADSSTVQSMGHTIGSTTAPPGGTWTNPGLQCQHCHETHGNTYYRNLVPNPGTATGKSVTYVTSATYTNTTAAIQQLAAGAMSTHYAVPNIVYRQSSVGTTDVGLSAWCGGCHGDYHVTNTSPDVAGHPSGSVTMAQGVTDDQVDPTYWFSTLPSRVPVVSVSGTIPGTSSTSDNQVFCGSCHKAHGSTNPQGLIYDDSTTAALEDGTTQSQTCQQCHYQ